MDTRIAELDSAQAIACGQEADFDEIAPCLAEDLEWTTVYGGRWKKVSEP